MKSKKAGMLYTVNIFFRSHRQKLTSEEPFPGAPKTATTEDNVKKFQVS